MNFFYEFSSDGISSIENYSRYINQLNHLGSNIAEKESNLLLEIEEEKIKKINECHWYVSNIHDGIYHDNELTKKIIIMSCNDNLFAEYFLMYSIKIYHKKNKIYFDNSINKINKLYNSKYFILTRYSKKYNCLAKYMMDCNGNVKAKLNTLDNKFYSKFIKEPVGEIKNKKISLYKFTKYKYINEEIFSLKNIDNSSFIVDSLPAIHKEFILMDNINPKILKKLYKHPDIFVEIK